MPGYQQHPYAIILLVSALISALVGALAFARRESPAMRALAGVASLLAFWAICYAMVWSSVDLQTQKFWFYTLYFAVFTVPLVFLILVLEITRQSGWLTTRRLVLLSIEPIFMLAAIWTNDLHHLFAASFAPYVRDGLVYFQYQRGPLYWVNIFYSYGLLVACMVVLISTYSRVTPLFRKQIVSLIIGAAVPWVANFISLLNLFPIAGLDLTSMAFGVTAIVFYHALFSDVRMELLPMARSLLLHATSDGLVVLDSDLRIVDLNPSAETSLGMPAIQIIGQNALDQFPEWQDMLALIRANRQEVRAETRGRADFTRFYDVKATPIRRRGRITGYLVLFRDMTDRWQAEQELVQANFELKSRLQEIEVLQDQLRAQATRDPLTSLYNRRYLEEILEKELARAERRRSAVAIIMMDADHFKHINDRFGHKAGDRALQALARIIQRHIRKSDIACRYGGEEFVIVMPSTGVETASERAEQIRHDFYTVQFDGPETTGMTSLSIGIATYPHSGDRGDQVLDAADQAMYSAKTAGGNRIQLHERLRNGAPPIKFQNPIDPAEKKDT